MPSWVERQNQELLDDLLGRGPGDPDVHGHYPGQEPEQSKCELCNPKVSNQNTKRQTSTVKSIGAKL